uniref:Variant-surface-glycoprotein phospholipase C n=4 Tax=Trypanosoma brucei TaxID=5691 RepID=PHLC_TRYBB|nr:RecName: Full=Variant-surface-glycoprotein phospholipase C; Short=VSG lipase; AltName: Full=Glycosylphosphatidylinositol-specific phospholipase C; Short=GPI-PLC [Trypanosoma brucei brucei]CAA03907.1 glycosylphosphatidylinositol-specific phospholipase C [Trypanosoma brucei]CAA31654.1 unnamed protein product [Trypanosoma brucei]CAB60085.1 GPI-phospholipase C [Trypanosoma brucei]
MFGGVKWSPQSWMSDTRSSIEKKCIGQVYMVGAHNAGTHGIQMFSPFGLDAPEKLRSLPPYVTFLLRFLTVGVSSRWGRCQNLSIRQLLDHGVRYLDLRMNISPDQENKIYTTHFHISVPLQEVLKDVKDFLTTPASANEFVILDFLHFYGFNESHTMKRFVEELQALEEFYIPTTVSLTTPLCNLWQSTRRIFLVVRPYVEYPYARLRSVALKSIWVNQMELNDLLDRLEELMTRDLEDVSIGGVPSKMYVTQAIGTPRNNDFAVAACCGACPGSHPDLYSAAKHKNPHLLKWFYDLNVNGVMRGERVTIRRGNNTHGNILLLDFVQEGTCTVKGVDKPMNAVALCVHLNTNQTARS